MNQDLDEQLTPICQALMKLAKDFKVDVFLAINGPQLGTYQKMSQIHRLAIVGLRGVQMLVVHHSWEPSSIPSRLLHPLRLIP